MIMTEKEILDKVRRNGGSSHYISILAQLNGTNGQVITDLLARNGFIQYRGEWVYYDTNYRSSESLIALAKSGYFTRNLQLDQYAYCPNGCLLHRNALKETQVIYVCTECEGCQYAERCCLKSKCNHVTFENSQWKKPASWFGYYHSVKNSYAHDDVQSGTSQVVKIHQTVLPIDEKPSSGQLVIKHKKEKPIMADKKKVNSIPQSTKDAIAEYARTHDSVNYTHLANQYSISATSVKKIVLKAKAEQPHEQALSVPGFNAIPKHTPKSVLEAIDSEINQLYSDIKCLKKLHDDYVKMFGE